MRVAAAKIIAAGALVVLLTLALAACGGDDEGDSQGAETTTSAQEDGSQAAAAGDSAAEFEPAPLQVSGEGAELREAAEAVHAFYVTRARDEWNATCSRVAQTLLEKLEDLAAQSERKSCTDLLESFSTPMSNEEWREITAMDAENLRVSGEQATLVYQGAAGKTYSMPLRDEGGEWMMEALQGTPG
jgi:hypothetical protein